MDTKTVLQDDAGSQQRERQGDIAPDSALSARFVVERDTKFSVFTFAGLSILSYALFLR